MACLGTENPIYTDISLSCFEHKSYNKDYKYRNDVINLIKQRIKLLLSPLSLSLSLCCRRPSPFSSLCGPLSPMPPNPSRSPRPLSIGVLQEEKMYPCRLCLKWQTLVIYKRKRKRRLSFRFWFSEMNYGQTTLLEQYINIT